MNTYEQEQASRRDHIAFPENNWKEEDLSTVDVLLVLVRHQRIIVIITGVALVLGLLIAVLSPAKYTASASVIRETETEASGGFAGGLAALRRLITLRAISRQSVPDHYLRRSNRLGLNAALISSSFDLSP